MSFAEHQPRARSHVEHSSSMVGIDVPILDIENRVSGWITWPKSWGQDSLGVKIISSEAALPLGGGNPEPSWRRRMLLSGCRHHATPQMLSSLQSRSHSYKHFSPFLTDVPPGTDREKPRAHLTGNIF